MNNRLKHLSSLLYKSFFIRRSIEKRGPALAIIPVLSHLHGNLERCFGILGFGYYGLKLYHVSKKESLLVCVGTSFENLPNFVHNATFRSPEEAELKNLSRKMGLSLDSKDITNILVITGDEGIFYVYCLSVMYPYFDFITFEHLSSN